MPETVRPITFEQVKDILNFMGYELSEVEIGGVTQLHWQKVKTNEGFESCPMLIAILAPDFTAKGYDFHVYERNYIIDFLNSIMGADHGSAEMVVEAVLSSQKVSH